MAKIIKIKRTARATAKGHTPSTINLKQLKDDLEFILSKIEQNLVSCQGS